MRLLNRETFSIDQFQSENIPEYAILSHRWEGAETTLQEFKDQHGAKRETWCPGVAKAMQACKYLAKSPQKHIWIDTICIDKSSSAELQEAINSMYDWYEQAAVCVVYLNDVLVPSKAKGKTNVSKDDVEQQLSRSEWFTRGWTLQELLAPRELTFVDRKWNRIGSRDDFKDLLQTITGIDPRCFGSQKEILETTVAERMSWLSLRKTTRVEDLAYCMLGIFNVNISMLYGEGLKAFTRLQKQIIQEIEDDTIFVWQASEESIAYRATGIFAAHPSFFHFCRSHNVERNMIFERATHRLTSRGLEIQQYEQRRNQFNQDQRVVLNCRVDGQQVVLPIKKILNHFRGTNRFRRSGLTKVETCSEDDVLVPPSEWKVYQSRVADIGREARGITQLPQRSLPPRSGAGMGTAAPGGHSAVNSSQLRLDFESEEIRYSVFVV